MLRDAGNKYPNVKPINDLHSMNFSCIVDMPVEIGISNILKMKAFNAGGLTDYEEKARVAAQAMDTENAIYVHLKGPDEFGHDGDAIGKMKNIEEIDERFFWYFARSCRCIKDCYNDISRSFYTKYP